MNKRNLREEIEFVEIEIESAFKAKKLAYELVAVLEGIQRLRPLIEIHDNLLEPEHEEEALAIETMFREINRVVSKAKEVLGDGKTPPDYDL